MSIKRTIFKNTFWLSFSEVIVRLLKLVLIVYIARTLGATDYGKFSFALNLITALIIFADLGISTIITREFSKDFNKEKKEFSALFSLKIFLSLFSLFLIVLIGFFITPDPEIKKLIFLLAFYGIFSSFFDFANAFFRAAQKMEYEALGKIINAVVCVGFGLLFLFKYPSIINISYAYLLGILTAASSLFYILGKKFIPFGFEINKKAWKRILSLSWPLAFISLFAALYHNLDTIMLGAWGYLAETGFYNAAYRVIDVSLVPALLISLVFFPEMSKSFMPGAREDRRKRIFLIFISILTILALPLTIGGIVLAPSIINFFYGADYLPSILAFQLLLAALFVIYLLYPFYRALIAANFQKDIFKITAIGAVLNIILNLILIPKYTLYGAAIATFITYLFTGLFYLVILKKKTGLSFFDKNYYKIFGSALFSSLLMATLISSPLIIGLNIFLAVFVGAITYSLVFLVFYKLFKLELITK